ncbi:hypothetical protein EW146_g7640 [Bondarzewia mesenterica]|uniref:Uncharacterized protein n=1 Tax=Bondarzewia mesenterica TaxID=1095465 RepID=A0A4S4LK74_9AGAM|nr:hypothetical protein EW146_g7640 [Bondarzewia mesenterica]
MEEGHRPREDSGLYEGIAPSTPSLAAESHIDSYDNAAGYAAAQSVESILRSTPAGVPLGPVFGGDSGAGTAAKRTEPGTLSRPTAEGVPAMADAPGSATTTPFYKKIWFFIALAVGGAISITLLFVILYPVIRAIAQHVVNVSALNIDKAAIVQPSNGSFTLQMDGLVTHTGIFSASIVFPKPLNISWVDGDQEVPLGSFSLQPLSARKKRAYINQTTNFDISDQDAFGRFAAAMITQQNFTWRLESNDLSVRALRFPVAKGIKFKKDVIFNGINNFDGNVFLKDFQLPGDSPEGGINFIAVTELNNPSPFQLSLGTVVFNLLYEDVFLGAGEGTDTNIKPGPNDITLRGRLVPHNGSDSELAVVSRLFTQYINSESSPVVAAGQSTLQNDNMSISWLSEGLQALKLMVPLKSPNPINPIQSIDIEDIALAFSEVQPWAPVANSRTVRAAMELPFGFGLSIGQIENTFNITKNGSVAAGLSTPLGMSTSEIRVINSTNTQGTINITIQDTAFQVPDPNHPYFSQFNADLTDLFRSNFRLEGHARAVANMSIGEITLDPIKFNVSSGLNGLQGLKNMVRIEEVDVLGGTSDGLNLGINVSIFNPSNLVLDTGDLILQLSKGSGLLGTTLLPNLTLAMGNNSLRAQGSFAPNNSPEGQQTLNNFVGGQGNRQPHSQSGIARFDLISDVDIQITGYGGSTNVTSLLQAFETLKLEATLPALGTKLLDSASLEVLVTTGHENNISYVTVNLANPFTAGLDITHINSTVSMHGIRLGTIQTNTNFTSASKSTTGSPNLDFDLNMDPQSLFTVTRILAAEAGLDTAQLDGIVALGGYHYLDGNDKRSWNRRRDNIYSGFDLPDFVDEAFKQLRSDVELTASITIGDYQTTLQYTQNNVSTKTDNSLNFLLPILAQPIVQNIVGGSALGIGNVLITDPQQDSFGTKLTGSITQAGPFDALISFGSGLTISWSGQALGSIKMPDVNVTGGVGAQFTIDSTFNVADVDHLTDFTRVLLTEDSFDWEISGENLTVTVLASVSALGIEVSGISLPSKKVTLKGMNGLKNGVKINSFDLPTNDPAGGIHLTLDTTPSQVGIQLSSIGFQNYFESTNLGPAESNGSLTLSPETSVPLSLVGQLIPQSSATGLHDVSTVFNNFIHGEDSEVVVHGNNAGPSDVSWLNDAIKSLMITTSLPNQGKLNIIKSISLNELNLQFSTDTAYDPLTSSNDATASFSLPFDFPIDITALEQNITIGTGGPSFAGLIIPKVPSTTDVEARVIHLTFSDVPFAVFDGQQGVFQQFLASTEVSENQTMQLSGAANTDAATAVGLLSLTDIEFSVGTSIAGLQGLNSKPPLVTMLDVYHGYSDFLLIKVNTSLFNPRYVCSTFDLDESLDALCAGDVAFGLLFQNQEIGTADISNLEIVPGNETYAIDVHFSPQGDAISVGQTLLENYLQGVQSDTVIQGSQDGTPIDSLKLAISEIHLEPVQIPALHQNLITTASLIFPTDIVQTGVATTSFSLDNPFTASINLLEVTATVTFQNLTLGEIDHVDRSSSPIHADGHSTITSPELPFKFNTDPGTIIELLLAGAQNNHVDLGPLTDLFALVLKDPEFHPPINTSMDASQPTCVSGKQFDANGAILGALKDLQVTLNVDSGVKIDDYSTDLAFKQFNVSAITDETALYLIGAVAPPIVQDLVSGASLSFSEANITNISDDGFDLSLRGALTGTGPLDAEITFTEPVTVNWNGNNIAQIALPPVCAAADTGVPDYQTNARLTITDQDQFTLFATFLLHNPNFDWTISTSKLRVTALGTDFDGVSLSKNISFKAFNNLPGVTISNFQLPSDDLDGGIHIETDSLIPSAAQLGIDLGTVGFQAFYENVLVGPLSGSNLFLAPEAQMREHLSGRIIPQSDDNLNTIGKLFSGFLAGENQTLSVQGNSVQPSGSSSPVGWLSSAFKTLTLQVILPGQVFNIIQSISLSDLEIVMIEQSEAFAPLASSKHTLAKYKNPFGFSLEVVQAAEDITLSTSGVDIADLRLPNAPTGGGSLTDIVIAFQNQTLRSLNDGAFGAFFGAVTDTQNIEFEMKGSADIVGRTSIGDIPIVGILFNVSSSLAGINAFGGTTSLSNVSITGSGGADGSEYIKTPLTTKLENPSNISLQTTDVSLPVYYQGVMLGRAAIDTFNLVPGENNVATEFRYAPADANDTTAQSFINRFLQSSDELPLEIRGDSGSSPFVSLQPGLEGIHLSTSLQGLNVPPIITHINAFITLDSLVTNLISVNFDISNPLDTELTIEFSQVDSGVDGQIYAHFEEAFQSFTIPAKGTANSGTFGNVLLTQGALASLGIIPLGELDVFAVTTVRIGSGGYQMPWLHLTQSGVPTTYQLSLSILGMKEKVQSMSASKLASITSSASPAINSSSILSAAALDSSKPSQGLSAEATLSTSSTRSAAPSSSSGGDTSPSPSPP